MYPALCAAPAAGGVIDDHKKKQPKLAKQPVNSLSFFCFDGCVSPVEYVMSSDLFVFLLPSLREFRDANGGKVSSSHGPQRA